MTPTPHQPDIDIEALCAWLRDTSSGIYRKSATAADLIEQLVAEKAALLDSLERAEADNQQLRATMCATSFANGAQAAAGAVPEGFVLVPKEPTEEMWSGLARDIVMAWRFNNWTPKKMADFMESIGHDVPDWLRAEPEMDNAEHTISKGTCAVLLYKAMLAAAPPAQGLPAAPELDDLAMLTRKLVHSLKKAQPDSQLAARALDYLKRKGLQGSALRSASTPPAAAPSEPVTEAMPRPFGYIVCDKMAGRTDEFVYRQVWDSISQEARDRHIIKTELFATPPAQTTNEKE